MPAQWSRESRLTVQSMVAVGLVSCVAGSAYAGLQPSPPAFNMIWDASGDGAGALGYDWTQFGTLSYIGDSMWGYEGSLFGADKSWQVDWNVEFADRTVGGIAGGGPTFVTANIDVVNNMPTTETFSLMMTLPIGSAILNPSGQGSVSGTVTDLTFDDALVNAKSIADGGHGAIYTAMVDAFDEAQLLEDPFSQSAGGAFLSAVVGPDAFGPALVSQVDSSIGILLEFELSPGDSASFTSIFEVVPTPGALSLVALAGVLPRRRRRA